MEDKIKNILLMFCFLYMYIPNASAYTETAKLDAQCANNVVAFQGLAYFCSETEEYGRELHVSDGGEFSARLVKDIDVGPGSSIPYGLYVYKDTLYFIAETTATGYSLWKTDGTADGTTFVKSLVSEYNAFFAVVGETSQGFYFQMGSDLFVTNGTSSGTHRIDVPVIYIQPTRQSSYFVKEDTLFVMTNSVLFRVDVQREVTQIAVLPRYFDLYAQIYPGISFNDGFLMAAVSDDGSGSAPPKQLWFSDGSSATRLRSDDADVIGTVGNKLLFVDKEGTNLYSTEDGINDTLIKSVDTEDGFTFSPRGFQLEYNGSLVIPADGGDNLWITDGTEQGTVLLPFGLGPTLTLLKDKLIGFTSSRPNSESAIWVSDGTVAGSSKLAQDNSFNSLSYAQITTDYVYFIRNYRELWKSDGASVKKVKDFNFSNGRYYSEGQRLYYVYQDTSNGRQDEFYIGHSDGTTLGTYDLKYTFENGLPEADLIGGAIMPVLLMVLDEEE